MRIANLQSLLTGMRLCICVLGVCLPAMPYSNAQSLTLEVIELKYRSAEQVIPALLPLVAKTGTLSGMQNRLILRTTPANLAEIKRVLASIDVLPRRLMITVRHDADIERSGEGAQVLGTRSAGRSDERGRPGEITPGVRVFGTQSLENERNTQQVQVLEGSSAMISIGQSVPVPTRSVVRSLVGGRIVEQSVDAVQYRDIISGFEVLPRLAGDRVTLEINPQRDTPGNTGPGSVIIQRAATTVSGRLGEWLELGGVVSGRSIDAGSISTRTSNAGGANRRILLRVDELP